MAAVGSVVAGVVAAVVVAGVSGSGKSSLGAALAHRLGVAFVDGDDLHPPANVARMAAGEPLTDEDRGPWLDAVGARLAAGGVVVACSALRRRYRDRLRALAPDARIVLIEVPREELERRIRQRPGHFMPASLLDSQLATLEPPDLDEPVRVVDGTRPLEDLATDLAAEPAPAGTGVRRGPGVLLDLSTDFGEGAPQGSVIDAAGMPWAVLTHEAFESDTHFPHQGHGPQGANHGQGA